MTRSINPDAVFDPSPFGFAQARIDDGILSVSGQVGVTTDLRVAGPDVESQARRAFENLGTVLEAAGTELGDLSKVTTYMVDLEANVAEYRPVWQEIFADPYPCHTLIGVDQLSPFVDGELLVEIDAAVSVGGSS